MDIRNVAEEHEPGVQEYPREKIDFIVPNPPYNVLTDQKDEHVEYDVFRLDDMKDMAKTQGVFIKP